MRNEATRRSIFVKNSDLLLKVTYHDNKIRFIVFILIRQSYFIQLTLLQQKNILSVVYSSQMMR